MAKVLNSISFDLPAAPVSASVNDTFTFAGTPGFTGSGGVQRYDWKWEVDPGTGYVTIAASGTGLITSDTNPLVNSNSQTQNSITVTCDAPGSYTIRMAGAPTSGGSYTVLSSTQTVTVSAAPVSVGISGNAGTGAVGSIVAAVAIALSGVAGTGSVGNLSPSAPVSVAITGNAATGAVGSLAASTSASLSGNAATGAVGSLAPSASLPLSGVAGTGAVGTVVPSAGASVALTGNSATGAVGTLAPSASLALSGNAATGAVGTVVPSGAAVVVEPSTEPEASNWQPPYKQKKRLSNEELAELIRQQRIALGILPPDLPGQAIAEPQDIAEEVTAAVQNVVKMADIKIDKKRIYKAAYLEAELAIIEYRKIKTIDNRRRSAALLLLH